MVYVDVHRKYGYLYLTDMLPSDYKKYIFIPALL